MASSFIYRPHVHNLDDVITPDVLIDHLTIAAKGSTTSIPVPIDRLTTDVEIQVAGSSSVPDAALAMIGAGAGTLLSIASNNGNPESNPGRLECVKPLCRQAWRFSDVAGHAGQLILRAASVNEGAAAIIQEGVVGEWLELPVDDVPVGSAVLCTGLPDLKAISGNHFQIEIEDLVLSRSLQFQYWVEEI